MKPRKPRMSDNTLAWIVAGFAIAAFVAASVFGYAYVVYAINCSNH